MNTDSGRLSEVLRYMRTSRKESNEVVLSAASDALKRIDEIAQIRYVCDEFDCRVGNNEVMVITPHGEEIFHSKRFCEFMKGHKRVGVFCVTLGLETDREIELASHTSVLMSMALQAAAATKIEEECDKIQQELYEHSTFHTSHFTPHKRYSPGYYDLDITAQRQLFRMLDVERRIGVKLTEACEMVPLKSVSAFVGL